MATVTFSKLFRKSTKPRYLNTMNKDKRNGKGLIYTPYHSSSESNRDKSIGFGAILQLLEDLEMDMEMGMAMENVLPPSYQSNHESFKGGRYIEDERRKVKVNAMVNAFELERVRLTTKHNILIEELENIRCLVEQLKHDISKMEDEERFLMRVIRLKC